MMIIIIIIIAIICAMTATTTIRMIRIFFFFFFFFFKFPMKDIWMLLPSYFFSPFSWNIFFLDVFFVKFRFHVWNVLLFCCCQVLFVYLFICGKKTKTKIILKFAIYASLSIIICFQISMYWRKKNYRSFVCYCELWVILFPLTCDKFQQQKHDWMMIKSKKNTHTHTAFF